MTKNTTAQQQATQQNSYDAYYGVYDGHIPGVYTSLHYCQKVARGPRGVAYEVFDNFEDAQMFASLGKLAFAPPSPMKNNVEERALVIQETAIYNKKEMENKLENLEATFNNVKINANAIENQKMSEEKIEAFISRLRIWNEMEKSFTDMTLTMGSYAKEILSNNDDGVKNQLFQWRDEIKKLNNAWARIQKNDN